MRIVKTGYKASDFCGVAHSEERVGKRHNQVRSQLEDFMVSGAEVAMVYMEPGEYSSVWSARAMVLKAAKVSGINIHTTVRNGIIYVVKKEATPTSL